MAPDPDRVQPSATSHLAPMSWAAAGLAAAASLLHWIGGETTSHSVTPEGVYVFVAGTALIVIAVTVALAPRRAAASPTAATRTMRRIFLLGAAATVVVLLWYVIQVVVLAPGGAVQADPIELLAVGLEVALIGVLLRLAYRAGPESDQP